MLLAHNPKLAPLAEREGFDLQLSGHTHAGQFFPWTLAVRLVHAPHVVGLSRRGPCGSTSTPAQAPGGRRCDWERAGADAFTAGGCALTTTFASAPPDCNNVRSKAK